MEGDAKKLVWTIGAQLIALTIGLLTIALIVWVSGKAWKKSQAESNYNGNWLNY